MLENIYKIFTDKAQYASQIQNRNIMCSLKIKTSGFQNKAVHLIENQLHTRNTIVILEKIISIYGQSIYSTFNLLKGRSFNNKVCQKINMKIQCTLLYIKLKKLLQKQERKAIFVGFKMIKAIHSIRKKQFFGLGPTLPLNTNHLNLINKTNNLLNKEKNKNLLSILDISEIRINNPKEAIFQASINEISYLSTNYNHKICNSVANIKTKISEKKQYLKQLQEKQKQDIYPLLNRLTQIKNKKQLQESIHTNQEISNMCLSWRHNKDDIEEDEALLIGRLIKKNHQLEQKLQEVLELLGRIKVEARTEVGKKLKTITGKKCFHISFSDQNQIL